MEQQFYEYLKFEQQLLEEFVRLAGRQQNALTNYNITELEEITSYQDELLKNVKLAEEKRISLLAVWLGISKKEASNIQLSAILKQIVSEDLRDSLYTMQKKLTELIDKLHTLNATNRLLTNRARFSIKEMISAVTAGNPVCNTTV